MFEKTKNYLRVVSVKIISLYGDSYRCEHFFFQRRNIAKESTEVICQTVAQPKILFGRGR